jgi:hypothetical protein
MNSLEDAYVNIAKAELKLHGEVEEESKADKLEDNEARKSFGDNFEELFNSPANPSFF